jgi:hypothetical protein
MINIQDIKFYGSIPISTLKHVLTLIPHCEYIKSSSDYKLYLNTKRLYRFSHICKELVWWTETLEGNPNQ